MNFSINRCSLFGLRKLLEVTNFDHKFNAMHRHIPTLFLVTIFFLNLPNSLAQKKKRSDFYGQSNIDLLRTKVKNHAVIFSLGATNMLTFDKRRVTALNDGTNREYFFQSGGKFGSMVEIGMLHFTKRSSWKFIKIDHYDWAVGVKDFKGWEETYLITRNDQNLEASRISGQGNFSLTYLTGRASFHNVIKLSSKFHLDQALGVNLDYRIGGSTPGDLSTYTPIEAVLPQTQKFQTDFMAQIHYEIGVRFRLVDLLYLTPSLQVPLISAYPWSNGRSTINWFSTKYQPFLIKLKLMIPLVEKQGKCPATYSNPDDERRNKEYLEGR